MRIFERFRPRRRGATLSCAEVGRVLQSYLDDELSGEDARKVAEHLELCRRCGLEASIYTDVKDALANRVAPPAGSIDRLRDFGERIAHGEVPSVEDPSRDP